MWDCCPNLWTRRSHKSGDMRRMKPGMWKRDGNRVGTKRNSWWDCRPQSAVILFEIWFNTQMSRYWGWTEKGRRIPEAIPAGHWRSFTLLGAMNHSGLLATMTVESATDADVFLTFLDEVLVPQLRAGQIVVMDNLRATR